MGEHIIRCTALTVTAALLAAAASIQAQDSSRVVRVRGDARVQVPADRAILVLDIESRKDKLDAAKARVDSLLTAVHAISDQYGVGEENVHVGHFTILPANQKRDRHYVAANVTLTVTKLDAFDGLLASLVDAGIDEVRDIRFELSDPTAVRLKARRQAAQAARDKAEALVEVLGGRLGRLHSVTELAEESRGPRELYRYNADIYGLPYNVVTEERSMDGDAGILAQGQITITAAVDVVYELGE